MKYTEFLPTGLRDYLAEEILPMYDGFDAAHRRNHADMVISQSMEIADHYDVDPAMVYTIAAYHDTGLTAGRETHHIESGRRMRSDKRLREWFTEEQIETMAQAVEDHRASAEHEPRSIYGKIVAEGDRCIVPENIILRTIQYGLAHYPELDSEDQWRRAVEHLERKYGEGGYLRLWIPESPNAHRLKELRAIIRDRGHLREIFDEMIAKA